jgi:penicillin-binding protein 2
LDKIIKIGPNERERILREVARKRRFVPVVVRDDLTWRDVARIEVNAPDLAGVMIDVGQSRHYLDGTETAPILGYVGAVSESEVGNDPLLELPGFRIGKAGVEKVHDLALRGRGGASQVEVNALGRPIKELDRVDGIAGAELQLTIDLEIQKMATERFGDESGAAVILDIHTGEVISLVSTPSYDPNAFNPGISSEDWQALVSNPKGPLNNKAIGGQYPPGSTFKTVVALAALEKGAITRDTEFFCPGSIQLGNARFHCWKHQGHGWLNLVQGITQSCDVYFYEVAKRIGIDRIAQMAERMGLGSKLGIDLPGEKPGLVPTRAWKLATKGTPWQGGETLITGIGQGYLLVTPLQLAVMTARLTNGGKAIKPRLSRKLINPEGHDILPPRPAPKDLDLHQANLNIVMEGMIDVVNSLHGTAYRARIREKGFEMGGKSGTVQVRRITRAEREQGIRKDKDLEWRQRDHAIFISFGPIEAPRYAAAVVVEHGGGGSSVAAPIAHDILLETMRRDPSGGRVEGDMAVHETPPKGKES